MKKDIVFTSIPKTQGKHHEGVDCLGYNRRSKSFVFQSGDDVIVISAEMLQDLVKKLDSTSDELK